MRIRSFFLGVIGLGIPSVWGGPFSDVPREDPVYASFRFLQEQGVLERTQVELPAEGALTRYEFAVATVDALKFLTALLERAPAREAGVSSASPLPEIRRCHGEMRQLLREFRPELAKLGVDVPAEMRKLNRFLKQVRSLPSQAGSLSGMGAPLPTEEPGPQSGSSAFPPGNAGGDRLRGPDPAGGALAPARDAEELQKLLERSRALAGPPRARPGPGSFSRFTPLPQYGPGSFPNRHLSLRTSWRGTRLQILHAEQPEDHYREQPYDLYGARASFDLSSHFSAGLTYLRTVPEEPSGLFRNAAAGQVYGADMRLPLGEYGLRFEYAQSQTPELQPRPAQAFGAEVRGPLTPDLTVEAAYRSVEASFQSPGFWGAWGPQANPTNIRGFRLTGDYQPQESLRFISSFERYLPLTMNPYLGLDRTLANLEYGLNDRVSLRVRYEYIRRRGGPPLRPEGGPESSITAGVAFDLSQTIYFRLRYRHNLQDHPSHRPADDNIALSELSVQF